MHDMEYHNQTLEETIESLHVILYLFRKNCPGGKVSTIL